MEEGADFILGETFGWAGEAKAALEAIQKYGKGQHGIYSRVAVA